MSRLRWIAVSLCIPVLVAALWGCGGRSHSDTNGKKDEKLVIPVEIAEVIQGDISAYFTGTATIEAEEETEVVAKVGGVVEQILVEEGTEVGTGDILAKLDDEKIAVQLEQAKANLQKLESNYERNMDLHRKQLISTEVFQQAKYEYEHQKATYELAELDLKYTSIRTPISGVVAERLIKVGNMILPNQAIFRVAGLNPLIAVLHIPERHLDKLRIGQRAQLLVDAIEGERITGTIKRISPVVDPATGTVKVTIEAKDRSNRLRPGMFARIEVIYDIHTNSTLAPKDAVISEDRESCVFVVRDSVAYRQDVVLGYVNTLHVEILEGLMPGDTIVTTGKGSLKDSIKVDIVSQ
ncbi:MAG: efflux RND transporter periplasmic adaptor subunit [bacterium]|nr:MAG: efflux RND transporter periplasmic adaptor subunit [bacterium]